MAELPDNLQGAFLETMGLPIAFGAESIVQGDRWTLDGPAVVEVRFAEGAVSTGQEVRLSIKKPGKITLTDGSFVKAVAIEAAPGLPRFVRHRVVPKGQDLLIYNAYSVSRDGRDYIESWTGNAGMIVTPLSDATRRYECSDGNGSFDRANLIFEVTLLPDGTPWLPQEIYA